MHGDYFRQAGRWRQGHRYCTAADKEQSFPKRATVHPFQQTRLCTLEEIAPGFHPSSQMEVHYTYAKDIDQDFGKLWISGGEQRARLVRYLEPIHQRYDEVPAYENLSKSKYLLIYL